MNGRGLYSCNFYLTRFCINHGSSTTGYPDNLRHFGDKQNIVNKQAGPQNYAQTHTLYTNGQRADAIIHYMSQIMKRDVREQYLGFYYKFMTKNLIRVLILQNIILPLELPSSQPESGVYCYTIINCIKMLFPSFHIFTPFNDNFIRRSSYLFRINVPHSIPRFVFVHQLSIYLWGAPDCLMG